MCGLFGWQFAGRPEAADRLVLAAVLMVANDSRGGDGWGFAVGPGEVRKGVGKMAWSVRARELAARALVMGHTRWATHGAKTAENAHPFVVGPITGAHNGCVWNHDELDRRYHRHARVDSLHLFKHLASDLPLSDLDGYGAVTWLDTRHPRSVYLGTFHGGELSVGKLSDGLVWSSSRSHLLQACRMAGVWPTLYRLSDGRRYVATRGVLRRSGALAVANKWGSWRNGGSVTMDIEGMTTTTGDDMPACLTIDDATGQVKETEAVDGALHRNVARTLHDGFALLHANERED